VIGADDLDALYDPDEFGCTVQVIEPGREARQVNGMLGAPARSGRQYRSGMDPNAANLRVRPDQVLLQMATSAVPQDRTAKIVVDGVEYSVGSVEPLGRLRSLLTLVPYGNRAAPAGERGRWKASS